MKKFLAMQDINSPKQLQRQLDRLARTTTRSDRTGASGARHRQRSAAPGRRPCLLRHSSRWARGGCALTGWTNRPDHASSPGAASPHRNRERLRGSRVAMLIDGLDIEIVGFDGSPLRRLIPIQRRTTSAFPERWPRSMCVPDVGARCLETSHRVGLAGIEPATEGL